DYFELSVEDLDRGVIEPVVEPKTNREIPDNTSKGIQRVRQENHCRLIALIAKLQDKIRKCGDKQAVQISSFDIFAVDVPELFSFFFLFLQLPLNGIGMAHHTFLL